MTQWEDLQDSAYSPTHSYDLLVTKYKENSAKGTGTWSAVQKKLGTSTQGSSHSGVTQDVLNSSSNVL